MNKKIIITILAAALAGSLGVSAAFASEVTGTLSSSGVTTQNQSTGQDANGTLTGSVVGGTATTSGGGSTGTVSSGGGGGGNPFPVSTTSTGSSVSGSTAVIGSEDGGMNGTVIAATPSPSFDQLTAGTSAPATGTDVSAPTSDQLAFAGGATAPSVGIPLAANAGGTPIGIKIAWSLLALLILIAIGYGVSRTYGNKTTGANGPTPKP